MRILVVLFGLVIFLSGGQSALASTIFSQEPRNEVLNGPILDSPYLVMFGCTPNLYKCGAYGKTVYNIGVWIKKIGNPDDIRLQVVDTFWHYPTDDTPNFSNSIPASSISDTSYTLKWFHFPNGVIIGDDQFFLFQFAGANNTYNKTDHYRALYDPNNSYNAPQQWCKIFLGCWSSIFYWMMDDGKTDLSLPPPPPDPCAVPGTCASNVLFLPGIEGSRLYYRGMLGIEHQVWEPNYHTDIPYLAMNAEGTSKYPLYTKDIIGALQEHNPLWDTIASIFGRNFEVYSGFERFMDDLVAEDTIEEWRAYPYDWRYDVRDIVDNGTSTEMPDGSVRQVYLEDILKDMASNSRSGRVTIVAHSNGGPLAKALAAKLSADAPKYIDRIVLVGTPQWGTPEAAGALLHADNFSDTPALIVNSTEARAAMSGMGGPYGLLPSSAYFARINDPVVTFNAGGLLSGKYATSFGEALTSFSPFVNFLTDAAGLNAQMGSASDLRVPLTLSSALIGEAVATHGALDAWTPPSNIAVTAVAGWGQDTVKTLAYSTGSKVVCTNSVFSSFNGCADTPELQHTPVTTQDGDSTVVSPSAAGDTSDVLYFNAARFRDDGNGNFNHQNLTSSIPIQEVVTDLLTYNNPTFEQYIVTDKPSDSASPVKLRISSHSPVNIVVIDASGNQSGVLPIPGTDFSGVKRDIPGSSVQVFDDEEYVSVSEGDTYQIMASGYATGSATLAVETISGDGVTSTTATFTNIPVTASSTVVFSIIDGTPTAPAVDMNGDGSTDFTAVSSSVGADPLAYVRYMKEVIGAIALSNGKKHELAGRLGEIERQLSKQKSPAEMQLDILKRYIMQQATLSTRLPSQGIPAAQAELILGMINQLKTLI